MLGRAYSKVWGRTNASYVFPRPGSGSYRPPCPNWKGKCCVNTACTLPVCREHPRLKRTLLHCSLASTILAILSFCMVLKCSSAVLGGVAPFFPFFLWAAHNCETLCSRPFR